jgi:membrane dipeptidase
MKKILATLAIIVALYFIGINIVPQFVEAKRNPVKSPGPYQISSEAQALYERLDFIADLHCDALLWGRDLTKRGERGHVDFPRMREANVALEMFTIVSKSPAGQNMESNTGDSFDNITPLTIAKGEGPGKWFSLFNRTLSQSESLMDFVSSEGKKAIFISSRADLERLVEARKEDQAVIGTMLGIEGGHALEEAWGILTERMRQAYV